MAPNRSKGVSYPFLFVVIVSIMGLMGVAFAWHKEAPHDGALTIALFEAAMKHIDYRFDELEKKH